MIGRLWRRNAHPPWRRLRNALRLAFSAALVKSHRVHFVTIAGHRYKQVAFPDSAEARRCEANLEALSDAGILPPLLLRHENEVWVAYVDGQPLQGSPSEQEALARFYAAIHGRSPVVRPLAQTRFPQRLKRDLAFLARIDVLPDDVASAVDAAAASLAPTDVVVGLEYVDPVLKNFLMTPDGVVAIDIEGLENERLLGVGIAKARLRWLGDDVDHFLARLVELGAPDLRVQFPFAELCFLAEWTKHKVLQGKPAYVRPEYFTTWLERHRR